MDEHPQNMKCSQCCFIFSTVVMVLSCLLIFVGGASALVGAFEIPKDAGMGVLITGLAVLILSITSSCFVHHTFSGSWNPGLESTWPSNYNASNTAFNLEVQDPTTHGPSRLPIYEHSNQQQAGSIQQVQTGTNQYTSAQATFILSTPEQTAVNHFPVAQLALNQLPPAQTAINRYPSDPADQPPPSYNEVIGGSSFI